MKLTLGELAFNQFRAIRVLKPSKLPVDSVTSVTMTGLVGRPWIFRARQCGG